MPRGWFQIGWSAEFEKGAAQRVSYFERELVVYRGDSGVLHALDGYCRHLGAHLGCGGTVEGDAIRCPFHGWAYGPDGVNVDIPYSAPGAMGNLRLGRYDVREIDGVVVMYYDQDGASPPSEPGEFDHGELAKWEPYPDGTRIWRDMPMVPQMAAENVVDAAHFKFVHRTGDTVGKLTVLDSDGPVFRTRLDSPAGEGTTWATPHGPMAVSTIFEARGIGLLWNRQCGFDDIVSLLGVTPTSPYAADLRATIWVPRTRGDGTDLDETIRRRWTRLMHNQIDSDLAIWNTQTYVARPPMASSETAGMRSFRRWSKSLYPDLPGTRS